MSRPPPPPAATVVARRPVRRDHRRPERLRRSVRDVGPAFAPPGAVSSDPDALTILRNAKAAKTAARKKGRTGGAKGSP